MAAQITLDLTKKDYRLYHVSDSTFPEHTYIVCSEPSRAILYNPHMAGKKLQETMESFSPLLLDAATEKALKGTKLNDVVEFVLLAGGLYYFMARGFRKVHGYALPQCFLGVKRQRVEGAEGQFTAVSTYENFECLPKNATVIIGDTIATGATINRSVHELESASEDIGGKIDKLILCSLACSTEGVRRIKKLEEKMRENNPDFKLYLFIGEQLFHLMPDGTDLRFLREDVVIPEETKKYTLEHYGERLGRDMKCAIFDWGTRCKNPKKHYEEFLEFAEDILKNGDLDAKGKSEIERMKKELLAEKASLERRL